MLDAIFRTLALIRKELIAIVMDPRSLIILILPPIVQSLLFGYAATLDLTDVPYVAMDRDRGAVSREFLARLDGSPVFRRVADVDSPAELKEYIDDRRALLAVQIDRDFERRLRQGKPAAIQVVADGRNSNTAGTALSYVNSVVEGFNADWRDAHGEAGPPIQVVARAWYNPNLISYWNMIPSLIGTLTLLQVLLLTAMSVAREREQGTFDQLLVTPYRPVEIMLGKAIPSMLIGLGQATLILAVAQLWFQIPFAGSIATLYACLTLFMLAAIGMGLLLSAFVSTMQQSMLYVFMLMMPMAILSGLTTPIRNMPVALQYLTLANPLRYAIDMAQRIYLEGVGLDRLTYDLWPLAVIAVITLPLSAWMFRHRLE